MLEQAGLIHPLQQGMLLCDPFPGPKCLNLDTNKAGTLITFSEEQATQL